MGKWVLLPETFAAVADENGCRASTFLWTPKKFCP